MTLEQYVNSLNKFYSTPLEQSGKKHPAGRTPVLDPSIIKQISAKIGVPFTPEKEMETNVCFANSPGIRFEFKESFSLTDLLDYCYAAWHRAVKRGKFEKFLKIDFPSVQFPKDSDVFWQFVKLGNELRHIHLFESSVVENYITQYPVGGSNAVDKVQFIMYDYAQTFLSEPYPDYLGAVYINETQYFADVPTSAWEFYLGGNQPAQKYLKDRKGRQLQFKDIIQYQRIIVALIETDRLIVEINKIPLE